MSAPQFPGWIVKKRFSSGYQGTTYQVYKQECPEDIYLAKRLSKVSTKSVKRFEREILSLKTINHVSVIKLVDANLEAQVPYIVVEFVNGGSFHDNKAIISNLSYAERLNLFSQICGGIHEAHSKNIIHRDIKPKNLLISDDQKLAKVGDFGIAYLTDLERLTNTRETVGAHNYMAPELSHGRADAKDVTPASDVYSLGKVLYWLFSGTDLEGQDYLSNDVNITIIKNDPLLNTVNRIIGKSISRNPKNRFQSALSLKEEILSASNQIKRGIPEMDRVYIEYYDLAQRFIRLERHFKSSWNSTGSTSSLRTTLQKTLKLWNEMSQSMDILFESEHFSSMQIVMEKIANSSRADRRNLSYMGDVQLNNAIKDMNLLFGLSDTDFVQALESYDGTASGARTVYVSSKVAQMDGIEYKHFLDRLKD